MALWAGISPGPGTDRLAIARDEEQEPGRGGDEASRRHTWMVEPFPNVPGSSSALALDSPVLHVDRKVATAAPACGTRGRRRMILAGMDVRTVGDLLRHYPRRTSTAPPWNGSAICRSESRR